MTTTPDDMDRIVAQWRRERPELDVAAVGSLGRLFRVAYLADDAVRRDRSAWPAARMVRPARCAAPFGEAVRAEPHDVDGDDDAVLGRHDQAARSPARGRPDRTPARPLGPTRHADPPHRSRRTTIEEAVETHARNEDALLRALTAAGRRALDDLLRKLLVGLERGTSAPAASR